jgi:hypothetical protein
MCYVLTFHNFVLGVSKQFRIENRYCVLMGGSTSPIINQVTPRSKSSSRDHAIIIKSNLSYVTF